MSVVVVGIGKVLHLIFYSGGRFSADQQAMVLMNDLFVGKASRDLIFEGLGSKGDDPGGLEFFDEQLQKVPEVFCPVFIGS